MRGERPTALDGVGASGWVEKVGHIDIGIYIFTMLGITTARSGDLAYRVSGAYV